MLLKHFFNCHTRYISLHMKHQEDSITVQPAAVATGTKQAPAQCGQPTTG